MRMEVHYNLKICFHQESTLNTAGKFLDREVSVMPSVAVSEFTV